MDETLLNALRTDRIIDITTTGKQSGESRRIEIALIALKDGFYISGRPGRPRSWYANLRAHPEFTLHLKRSLQADLRMRATPVVDPTERRAIFDEMKAADATRAGMGVEAWLKESPLVRLTFIES